MKKVYGYQWSEYNNGPVNFGDLLSEVVLRGLGYEYKPIAQAPAGAPGVLMVGTILDAGRLETLGKGRKVFVWGTGYRTDEETLRAAPNLHFRAVRGPLTRDTLWLSQSTALGDPALVLPRFFDAPLPNGQAVSIPHWEHADAKAAAGTTLLSPMVDRSKVLDTALTIARSEFVLTGSLHGAIVAQAYNVPWAFWAENGDKDGYLKWLDWAQFLGLGAITPCKTLAEGEAWWSVVGQKIQPYNIHPLLSSFPHEAAS